MWKYIVFGTLLCAYIVYSGMVFTYGTENDVRVSTNEQAKVAKGKAIFQEYNCIACHQLFGLGGYLGPDLTNAYSDPRRGEVFIKALLENGGSRMPNFKFKKEDVESIIAYLKYVDTVAKP